MPNKDFHALARAFIAALRKSGKLRVQTAGTFYDDDPAASFARIVTETVDPATYGFPNPLPTDDVPELKRAMSAEFAAIREELRLIWNILIDPDDYTFYRDW